MARRLRPNRVALAGAGAFALTFAGMVLVADVEPDAATAAVSVAAASLVYLVARLMAVADALARTEAEAALVAGAGLSRSTYRELLEEKRRVLAAIKELDFDHAMGKLSDEDHRTIRARYERRAAEVLRALDAPTALHPWARALAEGTVAPGAGAAPPCSGCGAALDADARFCKHCGTKVAP